MVMLAAQLGSWKALGRYAGPSFGAKPTQDLCCGLAVGTYQKKTRREGKNRVWIVAENFWGKQAEMLQSANAHKIVTENA